MFDRDASHDVDCSESHAQAAYERTLDAAARGVHAATLLSRLGYRHDASRDRRTKARHLAKLARVGSIATRHSRALSAACDELRDAGLGIVATDLMERYLGLCDRGRLGAVAYEIDRARRARTSGRVWGPAYFAGPGRN